jgi:hypothetical protein
MRSIGKGTGEKGIAGAMAALGATAANLWAASVALFIGSLVKGNIWKYGPLNKAQAHSLDKAILVVGLPPVFFFIGLFYYIYRRRFSWREQKSAASSSDSDSASS